MDKQKELDKISKEIENCEVCKIGKSGKAVVGEGNPDAKVVFIGEAPGKNEAIEGRPFIGRSGKLLRSMILSIGLLEKDVYITSPVKYLPAGKAGLPGGTPTSLDIKHGREHLMKQLEIIKPKIVVLLGRVAAEGVLQNPTSPTSSLKLRSSRRLRGARKVQVTKEHGKIIETRDGVSYFLTLHPAAVLRFPWKFKKDFEEDFKKLKTLI